MQRITAIGAQGAQRQGQPALGRRELVLGAGLAAGASLVGAGAGTAAAAPRPVLRVGSQGTAVATMQRRLAALGYWCGAADGRFGVTTQLAVTALQKVAGAPRSGSCDAATWALLDARVRPRARTRGVGRVIEVDRARQILMVVDGGRVTRTYATSTGSGERFTFRGERTRALTPSGSFRVWHRVDGWQHGELGALYRPMYFNGSIAVHGYTSVPSTPASHGCCRVGMAVMDHLWASGSIAQGRRVIVY